MPRKCGPPRNSPLQDAPPRRYYDENREATLPETSYSEDAPSNKPDYLLKMKDERPGRKARWTTVGAAWRRINDQTGQEFFSVNLNAGITLSAYNNLAICMFVNDGDKVAG